MISITRDLRKDLEKTVKQARRVAEAGARQAVQQLRVGDGDAPRDLTTDQRALRTRLRAHGRQLGDRRDAKTGAQETAHLVQECAYEHWHRMLFARFLAETDLLIEPHSGVAITLDEVQELAREKSTDWLELASEYAERMLPQIFRKDDPVLQIALPPETRSEMEDLLKALSKPVFEADDSLGWVYQFWQADKKDEVNRSGTKIGAEDLPSVTQLFTEDYMVLFLLHNTLGAWWAARILARQPNLAMSATDEAAVRAACKVGDIDWSYLRLVRDRDEDGEESQWQPAAGPFEGWPSAAKDIKVLDPCMGSGHFLVFALPILVALRMAEEGLSRDAAVDAVLQQNLFGLEIDLRCTQIAAFNLAFAAWRNVGYRPLPRLNLACSGLAIGVTKVEWLKLAEQAAEAADPAARRDIFGLEKNLITLGTSARAQNGLSRLYDLFSQAPWLGSLIEPRRTTGDVFAADFSELAPILSPLLTAAGNDEIAEMTVAAQGIAKAAELLAERFTLITTNVPYLGRGRQDEILRAFCDAHYQMGKADLATCFIQRLLAALNQHGTVALVSPQSWLFLGAYKQLRHHIIRSSSLNFVVKLGEKAFDSSAAAGAFVSLSIISADLPGEATAFSGIDAGDHSDYGEKRNILLSSAIIRAQQATQISNPDARIAFERKGSSVLLGDYATSVEGLTTGDTNQFTQMFWEQSQIGGIWKPFIQNVDRPAYYGGRSEIIRWEDGLGTLHRHLGAHNFPSEIMNGKMVLGQPGIRVTQMRKMASTLYGGEVFGKNAATVVPFDKEHIPAIWCFVNSEEFRLAVRQIDQSLKVTNATFEKVAFDLGRWQKVAATAYPHGLPEPSSEDPTQWLFAGQPKESSSPLHVAAARVVGYRWPRQMGASFMGCPPITQCDGLEKHEDTEGVVCLTALKGAASAEYRLNALLADAFGKEWSAAKLSSLLSGLGFAGRSLDEWLRDGFFPQHCDLFQQRPFIWQIWDGRQDGFHALVNYHRLTGSNGEGRRTLEKLIYSYLGDWIDRQRADQKAGVEGADARLAHAEHLKTELIKILEGEAPYDIFVRWKPIYNQPIGWDPDISDGVRVNIRPFIIARTLNARGTNACILRATPKIKWDKDRGKEPIRDINDFPWFWGWDGATSNFAGGAEFDGNRWNDLHYSRAVKQAARHRHRASMGGEI